MKENTSQRLYSYWNDVRGERLAPRRFDIEPARIAQILPETFILESNAKGQLCFRLAGTKICEMFGREFRGTDLLSLWNDDDRLSMRCALNSVIDEGSVAVVRFCARSQHPDSAEAEMLLLPLVHTGGRVNRLLGALTVGEKPGWLYRLPVETTQITTVSTVWPDGRPHAVLERMERQSPFVQEPQFARVVSRADRAFRVYDGGRTGE